MKKGKVSKAADRAMLAMGVTIGTPMCRAAGVGRLRSGSPIEPCNSCARCSAQVFPFLIQQTVISSTGQTLPELA